MFETWFILFYLIVIVFVCLMSLISFFFAKKIQDKILFLEEEARWLQIVEEAKKRGYVGNE